MIYFINRVFQIIRIILETVSTLIITIILLVRHHHILLIILLCFVDHHHRHQYHHKTVLQWRWDHIIRGPIRFHMLCIMHHIWCNILEVHRPHHHLIQIYNIHMEDIRHSTTLDSRKIESMKSINVYSKEARFVFTFDHNLIDDCLFKHIMTGFR